MLRFSPSVRALCAAGLVFCLATGAAAAQYAEIPDAFIVSIGVDEYGEEYPRFRGAVRDARALADSLEKYITPFAGRVEKYVLLNGEATRERIQQTLRDVAVRSKETDLFVINFAGHGRQVLTSDTTAEHFLVLPGTRGRSDNDLLEHRQKSIPARLLKTWLDVIPVHNQLMVIDAAYGQRFFWELLSVVEESLNLDAPSPIVTGRLAALAFDDLSPEFVLPDGRAHGALTYTILEGLEALAASGDGVGTVWELGEYVTTQYPRVIERHVGGFMRNAVARFFLHGDYFAIGSADNPLSIRAARSLFGTEAPRLPYPVRLSSPTAVDRAETDADGSSLQQVRVRPPHFFGKPEIVYSVRGRVGPDVEILTVNGRTLFPSFSGEFSAPLSDKAATDTVRVVARDTSGSETQMDVSPLVAMRGAAAPERAASTGLRERVGRDHALLFATGNYDAWPGLTNPTFDVEALGDELTVVFGFDVTVVYDATRRQMLDSLNVFASREYGPDDQLLVFFAGHGSYDEQFIQDGFVVASDSKAGDDDTYKDTMVQYNWIRRRLTNANADHVLLVLDVCYGGTFADVLGSTGDRSGDGLYRSVDSAELVSRKLKYRTRRYITSGGKERVPDGIPGEHTPFVRRLLEALRTYGGDDRVLTLSEVFSHLERVDPEPRAGEFERNEPGSDFLFIAR